MKHIIDLLGRLFIASIFIFETIDTFVFYKETKQLFLDRGFTWHPDFFIVGSIVFLILGSLLIILGYRVKFAVILLLFYFIPLTFLHFNFWAEEGVQKQLELVQFIKHLAILGGLLTLYNKPQDKYAIKRILSTTNIKY